MVIFNSYLYVYRRVNWVAACFKSPSVHVVLRSGRDPGPEGVSNGQPQRQVEGRKTCSSWGNIIPFKLDGKSWKVNKKNKTPSSSVSSLRWEVDSDLIDYWLSLFGFTYIICPASDKSPVFCHSAMSTSQAPSHLRPTPNIPQRHQDDTCVQATQDGSERRVFNPKGRRIGPGPRIEDSTMEMLV